MQQTRTPTCRKHVDRWGWLACRIPRELVKVRSIVFRLHSHMQCELEYFQTCTSNPMSWKTQIHVDEVRCHPCSFSTINIPSDDAKIVNLYTSQFPVLVQVILQEYGRELCSVNRPAISTPWEPLDVYEMMFEVSCKSTLITSVRTPDDVDEDNIVTSTVPYCKLK